MVLYNLTPNRELTQAWCELSPWGDSDQHAAYIPSRASASAVLPYVCWYSVYLPTEGWRVESTPGQVELEVDTELRTCCMTICCSTNWAILARTTSVDNLSIVGSEWHTFTWTFNQAMFITVNDPSLNRITGKYQLSHICDEVLSNQTSNSSKIHPLTVALLCHLPMAVQLLLTFWLHLAWC